MNSPLSGLAVRPGGCRRSRERSLKSKTQQVHSHNIESASDHSLPCWRHRSHICLKQFVNKTVFKVWEHICVCPTHHRQTPSSLEQTTGCSSNRLQFRLTLDQKRYLCCLCWTIHLVFFVKYKAFMQI